MTNEQLQQRGEDYRNSQREYFAARERVAEIEKEVDRSGFRYRKALAENREVKVNNANFIQMHEFVRGRGSHKTEIVGVLLATRENQGAVIVTGSKANISMGDVFNKEIGLDIAANRYRAVRDEDRENHLPYSFKEALKAFEGRCSRYFRTEEITVPELIID